MRVCVYTYMYIRVNKVTICLIYSPQIEGQVKYTIIWRTLGYNILNVSVESMHWYNTHIYKYYNNIKIKKKYGEEMPRCFIFYRMFTTINIGGRKFHNYLGIN